MGAVVTSGYAAFMLACIALIRGINVGGKNILPMAELRALCEQLRFQDVKTYIQSGNVVFRIEEGLRKGAQEGLERAIERSRGFRPLVIIRQLIELQYALDVNPFATIRSLDKSRCLIMFPEFKPHRGAARALEALDSGKDRARLLKGVVYLHLPNGVAKAEISMAGVENALGVPGTCRNLKTLEKLVLIGTELKQ